MTKTTNRAESGKPSDRRVDEHLKAPYARILMPESDGTFTAEILEFPGCLAQGDTAPEALSNLEAAARGWIAAALEQGQEIPTPTTSQGFSGRVALRLPRGLHRRAVRYAERDGTSLNQFLVTAVAARVGAEDIFDKIAKRGFGTQVNVTRQNMYTVTNLSFENTVVTLPATGHLAVSAYDSSSWGGLTGALSMGHVMASGVARALALPMGGATQLFTSTGPSRERGHDRG